MQELWTSDYDILVYSDLFGSGIILLYLQHCMVKQINLLPTTANMQLTEAESHESINVQ